MKSNIVGYKVVDVVLTWILQLYYLDFKTLRFQAPLCMYVIAQNQNNIYRAPRCYALLMMINIAMQLELNFILI